LTLDPLSLDRILRRRAASLGQPRPAWRVGGACAKSLATLALLSLASPRAQAATLPDFAEPARTGQRNPKDAAVVIGVENYTDVPDVPYARRDAEAFDGFARYTIGIPDERVTLLRDARAYEIKNAVKDAGARVGAGGRLWVYFAGHGAMEPNGSRRLLLGRDASTDPEAFAQFAVAVDDVRTWATSGGGDVMLVVDACYNGGGRTGEGVLTGGRRNIVPAYEVQSGAHATEWAATAPAELSAPLSPVSHGAFTYFAVGALRGWADGEVDMKRDGNVTAEEANKYVVRALRTVQAQGQTPQMVSADAATLVLARGVKELGPDKTALLALRDALLVPVVSAPRSESGGSGGGDLAADIAALKRAKAMVAARDAKLAELSVAKAAEGAAAWRELSAVLSDGSAAEKSLVEKYIATWTAAKVWVDDAEGRTERAVVVAEVDGAKAWLGKYGKGSGSSDWTSPTLGAMKWIPAGTFRMGSPSSESGRSDDETQHSVTLTKGYWLMEHEVTQGEWQAVMGSNPSYFTACGPTCPVEHVSWDDAVAFAKKASARDGVTYTLPTEAQWEYAARGGRSGELYSGSNEATSVGWISDNSGGTTHAVCGKARNGYGLCDMTGNVWEWTSDGYGDYGGSATDPTGAATGSFRVGRGGSWFNSARVARVAIRGRNDPAYRDFNLGFRLSRTGT
jgi:formylglycine-generating enzyme required for sulfatase activity